MTKNIIIDYLIEERFENTRVTTLKVIKKLQLLDDDTLQYFKVYHDHRVSCLGKKPLTLVLNADDFINDMEYEQYKLLVQNGTYNSLASYRYERGIVLDYLGYTSTLSDVSINDLSMKDYIGLKHSNTPNEKFKSTWCILEFIKINNLHTYNGKFGGRRFIELQNYVPPWSTYYPSLNDANHYQIAFYKKWKTAFLNDEYIDVDGNLSYIFVYMYDLVKEYLPTSDIECIEPQLKAIAEHYSMYDSVSWYALIWLRGVYLSRNKYDKAWEITRGIKINIDDIINIQSRCNDVHISAEQLLGLTTKGDLKLTHFGEDNFPQILDVLDEILLEHEYTYKTNVVCSFINKYCKTSITIEEVNELRKLVVNNDFKLYTDKNYKTKEEWANILINSDANKIREGDFYKDTGLFPGISGMNRYNVSNIENTFRCPQLIKEAFSSKVINLVRDAENIYRERNGIPKIGEGWVSETELFNKIKKIFVDEDIIQHASPTWLGKQHLDIYFPKYNIGIEYQGLQHDEPVDYFGGVEAFKENQKRDKRKKSLCLRNGCNLIYVRPGYVLEELVVQIKQLI